MFNSLSPAIKVFMSLILAIIIALVQWEITLIICAIAVILSMLMTRTSLQKILATFKPMWVFIIVLAVVTSIISGISTALILTVRIALITATVSQLLATTNESELERGIRTLLKPLSVFHIPVQDIAFVIALTLRFIPRITEEWSKLTCAREARGVILNDLPVKNRIRITFESVSTLLRNSMNNAQDTAIAIDSRGYGLGKFTPRKKDKLKKADYAVLTLFTIFCIFLVLLEFLH